MSTINEAANGSQPRTWPDLEFIRRRISVRDVARELGVEVFGNSARCWRSERHQHNDRSPSLSFTSRNRWRCHVCDERTRSNIDLVMAVLGSNLADAVTWMKTGFPDIPSVERREPRALAYPRGIRAGVAASPLDDLIRSGVWAGLSPSARCVLATLIAFKDPDTRGSKVEISMRGLRRFAGISLWGAQAGVYELEEVGLLRVQRKSPRIGAVRAPNSYELTFESPRFLETAALISQTFRGRAEAERASQRKATEARRSVTLGNTRIRFQYSRGFGVLPGNTVEMGEKVKTCGQKAS